MHIPVSYILNSSATIADAVHYSDIRMFQVGDLLATQLSHVLEILFSPGK